MAVYCREGVYVTVKLEFSYPANLSLLDPFIVFLRAGGDTLKTDEVYLKLSRHGKISYDVYVCVYGNDQPFAVFLIKLKTSGIAWRAFHRIRQEYH